MFYLYEDWTTESIPRCFYVGKGTLNRIRKRERNAYWKAIATKHGFERRVVLGSRDETFVLTEEIAHIAKHNTFHGWGANLTTGGEGTSGRKHTQAARDKMRVSRPSIVGSRNPMSRESLAERGAAPSGILIRGEQNPAAKLTREPVAELRSRYAAGGCSYRSLAREYDMAVMPVYDAIVGRTWSDG